MQVDVSAPFDTRVRQALGDEHLRVALDRATSRLSTRRAEAMAAIDGPQLRDDARAVRQEAIDRLPTLLEELEQNLTDNGCQVHWAQDAAEATRTVREIAERARVKRIVKSKSMVTEEIRLTASLERAGLTVTETDLGEYIIQLADEPPSHIIAPVIHKRVEDVSELFHNTFGTAPTLDPSDLCATARSQLRGRFLDADMGISGCNFAISETGTICLITNEGNGRMVSSLPRLYVVVLGIEKVVPTVEGAILLWQAAARNATGQNVSVYFSMNSGPRKKGHPDGPDEMHVVLLDNGRSRVLERGYGEALLCIRCGACLNACPVYRHIGGHAYGQTAYNGPIGAVITPLLADDASAAKELPFASSLCGACRDVCPVKINLPRLLLDLRRDMAESGHAPVTERAAMRSFARVMQSARARDRAVSAARWLTRMKLLPPIRTWMRSRVFPGFARERFRRLWSSRARRAGKSSDAS